MSNRSYQLQFECLAQGRGYIVCEQHQAQRIVLKEITVVPSKAGRKSYRIQRNVATFYGADKLPVARDALDRLQRSAGPRAKSKRPLWGRSLTQREYLDSMAGKKEQNNG
jgi:hypothetical protein